MTDKEFYQSVPFAPIYMAAVRAVFEALMHLELEFLRRLVAVLDENYRLTRHYEDFDERTYWSVRQWLVRLLAELSERKDND